MITVLTTE